jgi:hypothetical protein
METRTKYALFLAIFLIVILTASIFADDSNNSTLASVTKPASTTELQKFYDIANAQVSFYSTVANSMISLVPSDALTADIAKLQADVTQIQTYVTAADRDSLTQFVKGTFQPDINTIKQDILAWRQANYKTLTAQQKISLLSGFVKSKSDFQTNQLNAYKDFADGRINYFNNVISVYQKRIDSLSAKGLDVSSLTQLLSDAQATIITPLQEAVNSAANASSLNQDVKQYALFDGSQGGINFHLAAKFNVAELQIALNKLSSTTGVSQTSITQLQNDINTANAALTAVGTDKYTAAQESQIWNAIKDGWSAVKSASNSISNSKVNSTTNSS